MIDINSLSLEEKILQTKVAQMKKGAYYITSGILDVKEDVVVKAVKDAGLEVLEVTHQGEWVSVTARKQA